MNVPGNASAESQPPRTDVVGFVGPGGMGGPVVRHLLDSGVRVIVFDADPAATRALADHGAAVASDLRELADAASTIVCMLPHPDVFRDVVLGERSDALRETLRPGDLVIDLSTDGPELVRECRDALLTRGIELIDSPVGRGRAAAGSGTLLLMVGAEPKTMERARWVLEIMGDPVLHCGPPGAGQVVKLANNLVSCATVALIAEAHELAHRGGADLDALYTIMSTTAADSAQLRNTVMGKALEHDFVPEFKLRHAEKDLLLIRQLQRELASRAGCSSGALDWYTEAVEQTLGDLDAGALTLMADPDLAERTAATRQDTRPAAP